MAVFSRSTTSLLPHDTSGKALPAGCTGCKISGVCGKTPQVAHAQDLLIYVLKGLGVIANHHQHGCGHDYCDFRKSIHAFVNDALFSTITNANFDAESIYVGI